MNSSSTRPPNSELRCCSRSGRIKREDSRRIRRLWWPDMRVALPPLEPCSAAQAAHEAQLYVHCPCPDRLPVLRTGAMTRRTAWVQSQVLQAMKRCWCCL